MPKTKRRAKADHLTFVENLMESILISSKGRFGVVSPSYVSRVAKSDYDTVKRWIKIIAIIQKYPSIYVFQNGKSYVIANIPEGSVRKNISYTETDAKATKTRSVMIDGEEIEVPKA